MAEEREDAEPQQIKLPTEVSQELYVNILNQTYTDQVTRLSHELAMTKAQLVTVAQERDAAVRALGEAAKHIPKDHKPAQAGSKKSKGRGKG
jgi:hypothetical protein